MKPELKDIIEYFSFDGEFLETNPYGFGYINDTYAAWFRKADGTKHRYLIQRINHKVFNPPEKLMQNLEKITSHLRKKIVADHGDPERETLNLVLARDGNSFYKTEDGNYWRAYLFIENARTYQSAEKSKHVYNAAKAFGRFQKRLSDFPVEQLYEIIPDFHHTARRFQAFVEAVEKDVVSRAQSVKAEIAFVEKRAEETSVLVDLIEQGKLPQRVIHNDTKFNNVMIDDETGEGICVIDLDTVMPGLSVYDFGDSVRSGANTADEDERDLLKVSMSINTFELLAHGYLDIVRDFLTPAEMDYLAFSAKLITFENGIRFLADHLNGDVYYKIQRENHNLDRCRTQFKMVSDMEEKFDRMLKIIETYR